MMTTLIKTTTPSSKMSTLTGMESVGIKMVGILFIVILNVTHLSAQNVEVRSSLPILYPTSHYQQKTKSVFIPVKQKVYTLFAAKHFPKLEGSKGPELLAMNDSEIFDYDVMFESVGAVLNLKKSVSLALSKPRKSGKKLAPKLNS